MLRISTLSILMQQITNRMCRQYVLQVQRPSPPILGMEGGVGACTFPVTRPTYILYVLLIISIKASFSIPRLKLTV